MEHLMIPVYEDGTRLPHGWRSPGRVFCAAVFRSLQAEARSSAKPAPYTSQKGRFFCIMISRDPVSRG